MVVRSVSDHDAHWQVSHPKAGDGHAALTSGGKLLDCWPLGGTRRMMIVSSTFGQSTVDSFPPAELRTELIDPLLRPDPESILRIHEQRPDSIDAILACARRRREALVPGTAPIGRMTEPLQRADPQIVRAERGQCEHVLALNPADHRILRGGRAGRVRDHRPGLAVIASYLDAVRSADVGRIPARGDAIGRHVLPLGAELAELPVGPGLPAVGREPPPVADGAVPDFAARPEGEGVDEIEGDGMRGGVDARLDPLPAPRSLPQHKDPLAIRTDPDRAVRRARQRQHVHAPSARIGKLRYALSRDRASREKHEPRAEGPTPHTPRR